MSADDLTLQPPAAVIDRRLRFFISLFPKNFA